MEKRKLRKKSIIKTSFKMIYNAAIHLILFEIIYKSLITILFKPLINIIIFIFIRAKGYEILINEEISSFLLSFTGILMILVVMTISVILVYYEFSVILLILDRSKKEQKINLSEIS